MLFRSNKADVFLYDVMTRATKRQ